jgi:hypothetical protein
VIPIVSVILSVLWIIFRGKFRGTIAVILAFAGGYFIYPVENIWVSAIAVLISFIAICIGLSIESTSDL